MKDYEYVDSKNRKYHTLSDMVISEGNFLAVPLNYKTIKGSEGQK